MSSTMGTCTSTERHRSKQRSHNRATILKKPIITDIKSPPPLPPLPTAAFPNRQYQYSHCLTRDFDVELPSSSSSSLTKHIFHQADTNSLIQLYSCNTYINKNNNNNNNNNSHRSCNIIDHMASSSSSSLKQVPPRIPVPKTRLPVQAQTQLTKVTVQPKNVTSTVSSNNQAVSGSKKQMSVTNRPPPPTTMQTRYGFIPRPTAPGLQQARSLTAASRSRSISPTSNLNGNSSSASSISSQRLVKTSQIASKPTSTTITTVTTTTTTTNTSKPKTVISPRHTDVLMSKPNVKSNIQAPTSNYRMRSRTPSRTSVTSSSSSMNSPPNPPPSSVPSPPLSSTTSHTVPTIKADVNAIRDRYRTQKRMNFFTRHTPMSTVNGSPIASSIKSPETSAVNKENKQSLSATNTSNGLKEMTPPQMSSARNDSTQTNIKSSSNQPPSAHLSQSNKHRQRAVSMLSSASAISDVLNQDTLLEDDNCSLKSDDLMCDYDDTLTTDSTSKNDRTDSNSLASISIESNKQPIMAPTTIPTTPIKPNIPVYQPVVKENRSATIAKCSTTTTTATTNNNNTINEKPNSNLRETLDELNRLSNRIDHNVDNEQNRRLTSRSVSLKPPSTYLPPLDDAEQIIMDVESYRQVMKDVMVVKTILHQLDRLLKHSDGANMTDSMIGSFIEHHDPSFNSRRYSASLNDGNPLNSVDENATYDDLLKEIATLRKEKEQDKQTIKLLQEQMYKYSSQTSG